MLAAGAVAVVATGIPRRRGLTQSQALVSMPGDLEFPAATMQADRVHEFKADREILWPLVEELVARYAELWKTPLELAYDVAEELQVAVTLPGPEGAQRSVAAQVRAGTDGRTIVHVRERYADLGALQAHVEMLRSALLFERWSWDVEGLIRQANKGEQETSVS